MIHISKLTQSFPGSQKPILDQLDLVIPAGQFCLIIGANGCGKSTLLKLITEELKADHGSIKCMDQTAKVVQDVNLGTVPELTLLENIALSKIHSAKPLLYRRFTESITHTLKELDLGLERHLEQPLGTLSGGQRQIIATVMAIESGRKILLLDEHTSALDPGTGALLMDYTQKAVAERNLTCLMVTHKMDDAIRFGERLLMLHKGKITLDVSGDAKKHMTVPALLSLFHRYEDELLISEHNHEL